MNQSKAITLDAVLREAILRDITKTNTNKDNIEPTLDSVLREAFNRDTVLSEQLGTSAFINDPQYDYANLHKDWTTTFGTPWKNTKLVNVILDLGGKPFPAVKGGEAPASPVSINQSITGEGAKTAIGYQITMYAQKLSDGRQVGTYAYLWENGKMTIAGNTNDHWRYSLQGNKIAIKYPDSFMKLKSAGINVIEGFLIKSPHRGGDVIFKDTNKDDPYKLKKKATGILSPEVEEYIQTHSQSNWDWLKTSPKPTYWDGVVDRLQVVLDFVGIVVPPADAVNVAISIIRERYVEAILSVIGLIPGVGDAIAIVGRGIFKALRGIANVTIKGFKRLWSKILSTKLVTAKRAKQLLQKANNTVLFLAKKAGISQANIAQLTSTLTDARKALDDIIKKRIEKSNLAQQLKKRAKLRKAIGIEDAGKAIDDAANVSMSKTNAVINAVAKKLPKTGSFLLNLATGGLRNAFRRSSAVYADIFEKMAKGFSKKVKNPRGLAATIMSFGDTAVRDKFIQDIFTNNRQIFMDLVEKYPKLVDPTNAKRLFNTGAAKPAGMIQGKALTDWYKQNIAGINWEMMPQALKLLQKEAPDALDNIADDVAERLYKTDSPNYYWDAYRTAPLREYFITNVRPRGLSTLGVPNVSPAGNFRWGKNLGVGGKFKDVVTSSNLYKKLDIAYNELREYNEIKAGKGGENISKQSLFAWALWATGVIRQSDKANDFLENSPNIYKILIAPDAKYHIPAYPGSLDSTAFQYPLVMSPTDPRYPQWLRDPANAEMVRYDQAQRARNKQIEKNKKTIYKQ